VKAALSNLSCMKKIIIKNVEYILKNILKNFFVYEEITGKAFVFGKLIDEYILFYSTLIANNETFFMPFSEFIDLCDTDPGLFNAYKSFVVDELTLQQQTAEAGHKKGSKKKKTR
jgi:hypothetical protein